jgi:ABC-type bacteriocin/lantibiotic exporter with double-glycine peptidase domain
MADLFTKGERWRIGFTYVLVVLETVCELALPALMGLAIDGIINNRYTELGLLIAGIFALILSGSFRKYYDTRNFGRIQTRLGMGIGAQSIASTRKIAYVRLLDDLAQFFDTYLPQAVGGFISTVGSVVILYVYNWKIASASVAAIAAIFVYSALVARRATTLNTRINHRMESEAAILQSKSKFTLQRHLNVLRQLRNARSDAEMAIFAGGWSIIALLILFSILFSAQEGATPGQIFSVLSYVLAVGDGFGTLPPMVERLTRTRDIIARLKN